MRFTREQLGLPGAQRAPRLSAAQRRVLAALPADGSGMTWPQLSAALGKSDNALLPSVAALDRLALIAVIEHPHRGQLLALCPAGRAALAQAEGGAADGR